MPKDAKLPTNSQNPPQTSPRTPKAIKIKQYSITQEPALKSIIYWLTTHSLSDAYQIEKIILLITTLRSIRNSSTDTALDALVSDLNYTDPEYYPSIFAPPANSSQNLAPDIKPSSKKAILEKRAKKFFNHSLIRAAGGEVAEEGSLSFSSENKQEVPACIKKYSLLFSI